LLSGLEAVEIKYSYLIKRNEIFRLDSDFFKKQYLHEENSILNKEHGELKKFTKDIKSFGAYSLNNFIEYQEKGIPFIRGLNLKNGIIDFSDVIYINVDAHKLLWKSEIKPETVLLSMSGTIGDVAFCHASYDFPMNSNQDIAKIRLDDNKINPYFIYVFLLTSFGKNEIIREGRGSVQQHVFLSQIEKLLIPVLSNNFQLDIETLIKLSHKKLEQSKEDYQQAETLLLTELDLLNFKPSTENIAIKSFSESFGNSGRLDGEYYQPKYDEIEDKIRSYKGGYGSLEKICSLKDRNHKPEDKKHHQYIELSNIGNTGDITGFTHELGKDLPSRARRVVVKGDVVVSSVEGSLEKIALVTQEFDKSFCSTGFYVISSNIINPETLLVLLKNKIMKQLLKHVCSGTILTAINKDEFLKINLPIIDKNIQVQITEKIIASFKLKAESKQLLDLAKQAVETAIEQDEAAAIKLIEAYEV